MLMNTAVPSTRVGGYCSSPSMNAFRGGWSPARFWCIFSRPFFHVSISVSKLMPTIMGSQTPPNNFMAFDENSKLSSTTNTLSKGHHKALRIPLYFLGSPETHKNDKN